MSTVQEMETSRSKVYLCCLPMRVLRDLERRVVEILLSSMKRKSSCKLWLRLIPICGKTLRVLQVSGIPQGKSLQRCCICTERLAKAKNYNTQRACEEVKKTFYFKPSGSKDVGCKWWPTMIKKM